MFEFIKKLFKREKKQNVNNNWWTIKVSKVIDGEGVEQKDTYVDSITKIVLALSTNSKFTKNGQVVGDTEHENAMLEYVGLTEFDIIKENIEVKNTYSYPTYDAIETVAGDGVITYYKGNPIDMMKVATTYIANPETKKELDQNEMLDRIMKVVETGGGAIAVGMSYKPINEDGFPRDIEFVSLVVLESDY